MKLTQIQLLFIYNKFIIMKKYFYLFLIITVSLISCQEKKETYTLKKTNKRLSFQLDSHTRNYPKSLFLYKDSNGDEYLTFQNPQKNEILFYNINTELLDFKTVYNIEGSNGVGFMWGYYIHNLDSIFITSRDIPEIYLTNRDGIVLDKYSYETASDKTPLGIYCSISFLSIPAILKENKLYIMPSCNRHNSTNPICATINLDTKEVKTLPYSYPIFPNTDNKMKRAGIELYVSRCYNGKDQFVYSFYFNEDLFIATTDHNNINKIKTKSSYFNKVIVPDDYGNMEFKEMCEISNYGNIYYDHYREVYYRIAYPKTEIDKNIKPLELMDFGRKNFSIIILDKDLNYIGETIFPDFTYNSTLLFIHEDGIYISNSHYLNPQYSDDKLEFVCFELTK